jgi:branched-subunit amino acid ABC-type transport system permease component
MLAGLAGVLIAPITFLQPTTLVLLVIPAMAAALIGQFKSFPIAFLAALVLGVAQSEMNTYVSSPLGHGGAVHCHYRSADPARAQPAAPELCAGPTADRG